MIILNLIKSKNMLLLELKITDHSLYLIIIILTFFKKLQISIHPITNEFLLNIRNHTILIIINNIL